MLETSVWIVGLGLIGGVVNALISDNAFIMPTKEEEIVRPGVVGNALIGAVAAFVIWALYGPFRNLVVVGVPPEDPVLLTLTLAELGGALLTGVGGARILSAEVDKRLLRTAAASARRMPTTDEQAVQEDIAAIAGASPAVVLRRFK